MGGVIDLRMRSRYALIGDQGQQCESGFESLDPAKTGRSLATPIRPPDGNFTHRDDTR
jgi:hypothetical protein